jgi:hypothetical protein
MVLLAAHVLEEVLRVTVLVLMNWLRRVCLRAIPVKFGAVKTLPLVRVQSDGAGSWIVF